LRTAPKALSSEEITERLKPLPEWSVERVDSASELKRVYRFASFEAVLDFMLAAAKEIAAADHHPRWENVYNELRVHLSTHSIGNRLSDLDFRIATHLEDLYSGKYRPSTA
jgi:pterin-4a-carbinolamine dehydratase